MWGLKLGREGPKSGMLGVESPQDPGGDVRGGGYSQALPGARMNGADSDADPAPRDLPEATFLFDHLPKTGGSAFKSVLEQIFGIENVSPAVSGRSESWAKQRFAGYRVINGHFHSAVPMRGMLDERVRITILRHPIDRIVSEYFYYRNDVERVSWNKLTILAKDHDLASYVSQLVTLRDGAISNRYCHHFASQLSRRWLSDARILSLAKQSLQRYDFVGIQELFVDSVDVFCCLFGLPHVPKIPLVNVTSSRAAASAIDPEARQMLLRANDLDVKLYEFALQLFQSRKRDVFRRASGGDALKVTMDEIDAWSHARSDTPEDSETFGDRSVEFLCVNMSGEQSGSRLIRPGETITISFDVAAHVDVAKLTVGIEIVDELGEIVFGTNTHLLEKSQAVCRGQRYHIAFSFPANLKHGHYRISAALHTGASHEDRCFHWCDPIASFEVSDDSASDFVGYCRLTPELAWSSTNGNGD
jgi:hypothetical protein